MSGLNPGLQRYLAGQIQKTGYVPEREVFDYEAEDQPEGRRRRRRKKRPTPTEEKKESEVENRKSDQEKLSPTERRAKNALRVSRMETLNTNNVKPGLAMYLQGKIQAENMKLASMGISDGGPQQRRRRRRKKIPKQEIEEETSKNGLFVLDVFPHLF